MSRSLVIPALLTAAVGVPYVATNAPEWIDAQGKAANVGKPVDPSALSEMTSPYGGLLPPQGPGSELFPTQTPLEGAPTYSLADVMRMDVTKEWVYQRWARKSTSLADLSLFGVRVPLVTGAQLYDLAGSLTYYFGPDGRVHRLMFQGRTGDTTQIVAIATGRFGLAPEPPMAPGEQAFRARRGGDVISELKTRPAPVLWESSPYDSFTVELVVQRPETAIPLSQIPTLQAATSSPPTGTTSSNAAAPNASSAQSEATAKASDDVGAVDDESRPPWKAWFPRSRVPRQQVDNLEKQRNMW